MRHKHDCGEVEVALEYWYGSPYRYDGVSEYHCSHGRFGRWCGTRLIGFEVEPPFCQGGTHPMVNSTSPTVSLTTTDEHGTVLASKELQDPDIRWVCDAPRNHCSSVDSPQRRVHEELHAGCGPAVVRKFIDIGVTNMTVPGTTRTSGPDWSTTA
jgi:hypothetical protein